MLVRFEVYPITGKSQDLERNGYFRMGIVRKVSGGGGATINSRAARLSLYEKTIWTKLKCLSLCLLGSKVILLNPRRLPSGEGLNKGHSSSASVFSDKLQQTVRAGAGERNKVNPPADVPACILTASPNQGMVASVPIVLCAGVLRQSEGGCGMMKVVSETWARVPSPQLWFRDPSRMCPAGSSRVQMVDRGKSRPTPALLLSRCMA
jgi:hypothetical protein